MSKKNNQLVENLKLNADAREFALYDIWQLLSKIETTNLSDFERALLNCAMSRAWEAGNIDFTE